MSTGQNTAYGPAPEPARSTYRATSKSASTSSTARSHPILYPLPTSENSSGLSFSGMDPLEMVEKLAKMTICSQSSFNSDESGFKFLHYLAGEATAAADGDVALGQKRKRESFDDYYEDDAAGCELIVASVLDGEISSTDTFEPKLNPWKPYAVLDDWARAYQYRITDQSALNALGHLVSLINTFEKLAMKSEHEWMLPSYDRIQFMFMAKVASLTPDGSVYLVIDEAVQQTKALMEMIRPASAHVPRVKFTETVSCNDGSTKVMAKPNPININGIVLSHAPLNNKAKWQLFSSHLTAWMCQSSNWKNPQPDSVVLKQMADYFINIDCVPGVDGTATEAEAIAKISTWLLNFRTRHWRPSLEQAFDLKRPAMLLLEDSLRTFKNDTLRPVVGWDGETMFANHGHYSKPISKWEKKKGSKSNKDVVLAEIDANAGSSVPELFPQAQGALTATLNDLGLMGDGRLSTDNDEQTMTVKGV